MMEGRGLREAAEWGNGAKALALKREAAQAFLPCRGAVEESLMRGARVSPPHNAY